MAAKKLTRDAKYALMYGDAGHYMAHLSHSDRLRVKQAAAKRGLTISGLLQGGPEALRERSTAGLRAQALKTVNSAYAPAEADVGSRVAQANALDEKRRTDNHYYADWLATQQHTADAASQASDAALLAQASQLHGQAQAAGDASQAQAAQQAQATPGNVSDPSQSTAIQGLKANTDKSVGAADIANAAAVSQVARSGAQRATSAAANVASIAALEARRQGETYKTLAGLSDESGKLKLSKAADMSKEIARLLDEEVSKAQSAQQTSILAQKLGLGQASLAEKTAHDKASIGVQTVKTKAEILKQRHDSMLGDAKFQLDKKKFGLSVAKEKWSEAHPRAGRGGAGGVTAGQRSKSQKLINSMENAIGQIHSGGLPKNGAVDLLTGPKSIRTVGPDGKPVLTQNPHGGYDQLIARAATEIAFNAHHRLDQKTYRALRSIGMFVPQRWKPLTGPQPQSGANASPRT